MKALLILLVPAVALVSCSHPAATDPRVVQLHRLHSYVDSLQTNVTVPRLKKLGYAIVTDDEIKQVNQLLAESKQNLSKLDVSDASQGDQLNEFIKQEGLVLAKIRQIQKISEEDAQQRANDVSSVRALLQTR